MTSRRATLPATPHKIELTPAAEAHLLGAINDYGDRLILDLDQPHVAVATELRQLGLITITTSFRWPRVQNWLLTKNGVTMRTWLQHQANLALLAEQVKAEGIDGEDLADLAAGIDAGEETGTITGTSEDFQLTFALVASVADCSGEDLRAELETYLGWRD